MPADVSAQDQTGRELWVQANLWFKHLDEGRYKRLLAHFVNPTIKVKEARNVSSSAFFCKPFFKSSNPKHVSVHLQ
jgi:hypothetical protein